MAVCKYHPGRPGVGVCMRCRAVVCAACTTRLEGVNHCHVCLRELAARNVTFRMGNSTFGVDPDPGRVKTLRIYSRDRSGRRKLFEYRESSTIDGSMFIGWNQGNWGRDPWNGRWNDNNYPR